MPQISKKNNIKLINELNAIAQNPTEDLNSDVITNSLFFKEIQGEEEISFHYTAARSLTPKAYILAIYILATSNSLRILNLANNNLGKYGPATASALATLLSLNILDLGNNILGEYGPATVSALAASNSLMKIDFGKPATPSLSNFLVMNCYETNIFALQTEADTFTDNNKKT